MSGFATGMAVHCIDNSPRADFARWYSDDHYSEDMLSLNRRYIVRDILHRDGQIGLDIGIPTPWGDPFWNAERFRPALLREPISVCGMTRAPSDHLNIERSGDNG